MTTEKSAIISEASNLATLKLLIFEAATAFLKERGSGPKLDLLRDICQRISVDRLEELGSATQDNATFEARTKRLVAEVVYDYTNTKTRA